ncbi:MAG TPA: hypothetical protein VF800_02465 [Telluria sp.]|jgi:hypothetical protein
MMIDWMLVILAAAAALIALSIWRAHRASGISFNAFDLIMEDGKVSKIALAFMLVLAVTTWIVVDLTIKGKLTEGYFTMYGSMWVIPLVAKVVFNKSEAPTSAGTTTITKIESVEKTTP